MECAAGDSGRLIGSKGRQQSRVRSCAVGKESELGKQELYKALTGGAYKYKCLHIYKYKYKRVRTLKRRTVQSTERWAIQRERLHCCSTDNSID